MIYVRVLFILLYIKFSISLLKPIDTENMQDILIDEERNARCCAKHMDCCRNNSETTSFEVRALLIKCSKAEQCCGASYMQNNRKVAVKNEEDEEQCENPSAGSAPQEITTCDKKLKLTIKIKNVGMTNTKNQYIIIDHVFDPLTEKKQKLLNPYVLKIRQEPILQLYGLTFENMVNSEANEKVINKKEEGYTGCNTDATQNPTCGSMKYDGEVVPYSTGFCCPCNNNNNQIEQNGENGNFSNANMNIITSRKVRNIYNVDVPDYNKDNYNHYELTAKTGKIKENPTVVNIPNIAGEGYSSESLQSSNDQRLVPVNEQRGFIQKRGGQDCSDRTTPPNVNPDTYHDSTHCLQFSDLWYSVYCLQEPKLYHSLQFQVFEKCQDQDGNFKWTDLTNGASVSIGTNNKLYMNDESTLLARYMARKVNSNMFCINYKTKKLLIPDASKITYNDSYPEIKGGPEEYLIVNENQVQSNGKSCNTAGVGYEAFAKQPNRCSKPRGTCLQNQPKQLWTHDHEEESQGKRGKYFLKYFGSLPENPIESTENSQNKTLKMYYLQSYTSILDLEIKADANVVLRANSLAIITEVYIDSSSPKRTSIIAKVFNVGLVSSLFFVSLTHCPLDLPASFNNIVSKPALIAPQSQHTFNLKIECPLPVNSFFCAVEVLNPKEELIAFRKIRLEKLDRCICIWHCLCACLLADKGLKCKPMSLQHYHAAGFQGSLPVPLHVVHYTFLDDVVSLILYILIFLCLTLLIMGLTKAIVGCFMVAVGLWGLDVVLDLPKKMNHYYEHDLKHRKVIYDENGWPVHPDTKERVRNISLPAEFSINILFFCIYPFALLWTIIKKVFVSSQPKDYSEYDLCTCKSSTLLQKRSSSLQVSLNKSQRKTSFDEKQNLNQDITHKQEDVAKQEMKTKQGNKSKKGTPKEKGSKQSMQQKQESLQQNEPEREESKLNIKIKEEKS